jgi:hypothetical protein
MDLFKLGLRNVLGITLPGAMLLLVVGYAFFSILLFLGLPLTWLLWGKNQQILILSAIFLMSYNLGALLRLNSADDVDRKSSRQLTGVYLRKRNRKNPKKLTEKHLDKMLEAEREAMKSGLHTVPDKGFDRWIWHKEPFPYPLWQFRKFRLYHPEEVYRFFQGYRACMLGSLELGGRGKEFFNYCKLVVYHSSRGLDEPLLDEIHFAEATVRFYAGTYTALRVSMFLLIPLLLVEAGLVANRVAEGTSLASLRPEWLHLGITIVFLVVSWRMERTILRRFRTLRLKEVDTVYDAFYLVHRHVEACPVCSARQPEQVLREKSEPVERLGPRLLLLGLQIVREVTVLRSRSPKCSAGARQGDGAAGVVRADG